jgi:RNA-directed DNA polymerase
MKEGKSFEISRRPWAKYADDGVIHCRTKEEAEEVLRKLRTRLKECKLEIHPEKTHIVYCRSDRFWERHENESFDFLGYTFRRRKQIHEKSHRNTKISEGKIIT